MRISPAYRGRVIFCDIELAARVERAEGELLAGAAEVVARRVGGVIARPICGGFAVFTEPGSPLNKIVGLGMSAPFDERCFAELERELLARRCAVQVELPTLAEPNVAPWLTSHGYQLVAVENVLGCELPIARIEGPPGDISIDVTPASDLARWIGVVVDGFSTPDTQGVASSEHFERDVLERVMRDFNAGPRMRQYLARREGELAGGASLHLGERIAHLCGAATLPAHRLRGVQSALLARRLDDAARSGCTLAVMMTQPGSKSQQNAQRRGFELLYSRNVLRKEPA